MNFYRIKIIFYFIFCIISFKAHAHLALDLKRLQLAYPSFIYFTTEQYIIWNDGTQMFTHDGKFNKTPEEKLDMPSLADQVSGVHYPIGRPANITHFNPSGDPGRIRYRPFFEKMYGKTPQEIEKNLITIYWMPKIFGLDYPLQVTTVNGVAEKLQHISNELEKLPRQYDKFLRDPGGTYYSRNIANTTRISMHSYGIAIDINTDHSDYWQWDLRDKGLPISESTPLIYKNQIPWEIVQIFEKYGFIWGGKWHHYDTMHFEYRPELFIQIPDFPTGASHNTKM